MHLFVAKLPHWFRWPRQLMTSFLHTRFPCCCENRIRGRRYVFFGRLYKKYCCHLIIWSVLPCSQWSFQVLHMDQNTSTPLECCFHFCHVANQSSGFRWTKSAMGPEWTSVSRQISVKHQWVPTNGQNLRYSKNKTKTDQRVRRSLLDCCSFSLYLFIF